MTTTGMIVYQTYGNDAAKPANAPICPAPTCSAVSPGTPLEAVCPRMAPIRSGRLEAGTPAARAYSAIFSGTMACLLAVYTADAIATPTAMDGWHQNGVAPCRTMLIYSPEAPQLRIMTICEEAIPIRCAGTASWAKVMSRVSLPGRKCQLWSRLSGIITGLLYAQSQTCNRYHAVCSLSVVLANAQLRQTNECAKEEDEPDAINGV